MADEIQIPLEGELLTVEGGRCNASWYRIFARIASAFNAATRTLADTATGLGTKAAKAQPEALAGTIQYAVNGDYSFFWPYDDSSITTTLTVSASGTATATFKREGVAFGGTANSVSTTENTQTHTAVAFEKGELVTITISSASSCVGLSFLMSGTRALA